MIIKRSRLGDDSYSILTSLSPKSKENIIGHNRHNHPAQKIDQVPSCTLEQGHDQDSGSRFSTRIGLELAQDPSQLGVPSPNPIDRKSSSCHITNG